MNKRVDNVKEKFINGRGMFMFLRSMVSSQLASYVDLVSSVGLVALGMSTWAATPIGAAMGGIVNCCINYKFTFRATGCSKRAVGLKYVLVWFGSLVLNTVGTALLTMLLERWHLLEQLGFTDVGSYASARLIVSLAVSLAWNYVLQKNFVYRPTSFDPVAVRIVKALTPRGMRKINIKKKEKE